MFDSLPHHHQRSSSRRKRRLIATTGAVAFVALLFTVSDFTHRALSTSDCFVGVASSNSGGAIAPDASACEEAIDVRNTRLQIDILATLAAIGGVIYAGLTLYHARRRTKLAVLAVLLAVLILAFAYTLLWYFTPQTGSAPPPSV